MRVFSLLIVLILAGIFASCSGGDAPSDGSPTGPSADPPRATAITLSASTVVLYALGATSQLVATVTDQHGGSMSGASVSWSSSNGSVATVDGSGLVTAIGNGNATIRATASAITGSVDVTVAQRVVSLNLQPDSIHLTVLRETAGITVVAEDSLGASIAQPTVSWSVSIDSVASVNGAGVVSAEGIGVAFVAAVADAGLSDSVVVVVSPRFVAVVPTWTRAFALTESGDVFAWGRQPLGVGSNSSQWPTEVSGIGSVDRLAAGLNHACIVADAGLMCWGQNLDGSLGNGVATGTVSSPEVVNDSLGIESIAMGSTHTCALDGDGVAYCWGSNNSSQLGVAQTAQSCSGGSCSTAPLAVETAVRFSQIFAGGRSTGWSCGLTDDGAAYCWGAWPSSPVYNSPTPMSVSQTLRFRDLGLGEAHMCGVTLEGDAYCWGRNQFGQLGNGSLGADESEPTLVGGLSKLVSISAGRDHSCALNAGGEAFCWGRNMFGQLGNGQVLDGTDLSAPTPVQVIGDHLFGSLASGWSSACGIRVISLDVYCWGFRDTRGDGGQTDTATPGPIGYR